MDLPVGNKGTYKKSTSKKGTSKTGTGKKRTNELDEISKEKCYELPSEFENNSNSTWHTATLTTQTCPRGNQR